MQSTVTRLRPRSAIYEVAAKAFHDGDFSLCAEALSENESLNARILQARALLRLGACVEASGILSCLKVDDLSHEYAAELLAVQSAILVQVGDPRAEPRLTEARARGFSSGFRAVECEIEFVAAVSAWTSGRVDEALDATGRVLELSEDRPTFLGQQRSDYIFSCGFWRSRAYDLRGLISALREDYLAQAASLANAFVEFDRGGVEDAFGESHMLANMAVLVRDIDSDVLSSFVESRADQLAWNAHTATHESLVFQAIGWNRAKRGDHLGAFRYLRRSGSVAPTIPGQITALLDRSFLAHELGETVSAQDGLDHALRLAKQVDWESAIRVERAVLFRLARQVASTDRKIARALWERYASLKSSLSPFELAAHGDRRLRADECSAHAAVLLAEGYEGRAVSLYLESFQIYTSIGYLWRAAALAVDLAELSGENRYYEFASREAAKQPNSWLARRVSALKIPVVA